MDNRRTSLQTLPTIEVESLGAVIGGAAGKYLKAGAKAVFKKALPIATAGFAAYEGGKGYSEARKGGASVGGAAWEGAKSAARSVTEYDLWGPTVFGE